MGLIPKGVSDEDKQLLESIKEVKDKIDTQEQHQQAIVEHNNKVDAIDEFNKSLEESIPGYDTKFMIQVVTQISQNNPEEGQKILDNPAMLVNLWSKVGAKAQPKKETTNVINTSNNPSNNNTSLVNKLFEGNATEDDEGKILASL